MPKSHKNSCFGYYSRNNNHESSWCNFSNTFLCTIILKMAKCIQEFYYEFIIKKLRIFSLHIRNNLIKTKRKTWLLNSLHNDIVDKYKIKLFLHCQIVLVSVPHCIKSCHVTPKNALALFIWYEMMWAYVYCYKHFSFCLSAHSIPLKICKGFDYNSLL